MMDNSELIFTLKRLRAQTDSVIEALSRPDANEYLRYTSEGVPEIRRGEIQLGDFIILNRFPCQESAPSPANP